MNPTPCPIQNIFFSIRKTCKFHHQENLTQKTVENERREENVSFEKPGFLIINLDLRFLLFGPITRVFKTGYKTVGSPMLQSDRQTRNEVIAHF